MNHHSYKAQYYWTFFLLRRIIFITVCIKSSDGYWQTSTFIVLSMICSCYVYAIFPFKYSRKNYVENFNEMMIFMCAIIMQVLAGVTMNTSVGSGKDGSISAGAQTRFGISSFVVACISLMVAVNVFFASSDFCHQVILHLKKWYLQLKAN
jgi:putative copper export protein